MIALIPARAGSKRLLRKNVLPLNGKPLISYTIEAAMGAHSIEKVYVSTDDEEVATIARHYGAEVPFIRPPELCTDNASTEDVCEHMLSYLQQETGATASAFMFLQATSPLRTSQHIDEAYQVFTEREADAVISVSEFAHPIQWALKISEGVVAPCDADALTQRSQDLEKRFHPNGALYIFRTDFFRMRAGYYGAGTYPFIMRGDHSVDIDTINDFELAEYFLLRNARQIEENHR